MSQQILWVGTRKGLFRWERDGRRWRITASEFLGTQVPMVLPDPLENRVYAALNHGHFGGKVARSDDGGKVWADVATPCYPPKPENVPDVIDPMRQIAIPWSLQLLWSLEKGADGRLWCGTIPGGLFTSDNRGETWELNWPLWSLPNRSQWFGGGYDYPGIHSICIDPRNPKRVAIAISCGGVWITEDGGESWQISGGGMRNEYMPPERAYDQDVQDPHRMVLCPAAPHRFWVQHHNGIFRSDDEGRQWHELTTARPSSFGFAVAVHPHDPDTAWFVPATRDSDRYPVNAQLVVSVTRNGGKTFEVARDGLPQEHAYHLVYRHGLDVDAEGSCLAMGSTTGGLWISDDGGLYWQCISRDLPPIFVVRFEK